MERMARPTADQRQTNKDYGRWFRVIEYQGPGIQFAVLGDVEPKTDRTFPNLRKAVSGINKLALDRAIAFTASVGDIAHRGSLTQYETASEILATLSSP